MVVLRILLVSQRAPCPPHKGNQIRPFNVLTALVGRGHEEHLLAFAEGEQKLQTKAKLEEYCASATLIPLDHLGGRVRALLSLPTIFVADDPLKFANAVIDLMNYERLRTDAGALAHMAAESSYS